VKMRKRWGKNEEEKFTVCGIRKKGI